MFEDKPRDLEEYKIWLKQRHDFEISDLHLAHYERVVKEVRRNLSMSQFWSNLGKELNRCESEYYEETQYHLFMPGHSPGERIEPPDWLVKPFDSFLLKTFRKNVLDNKQWPDEPHSGWVLPVNWFSKISDTVRTLFVVKYMDGVQFVSDRIVSLWEGHGARCRVFLEATQEGYYASHIYGSQLLVAPKIGQLGVEEIRVTAEIQVTTQLQEVIRRLLHSYYEQRRAAGPASTKWQWDHKSDEFAANYLGHILHYVEGMIMEIREKQEGYR